MPNSNAFGHEIGDSVRVETIRGIASEYNAALIAHIAAHVPTQPNRWREIVPGNPGGVHRGHDLNDVYPVLGHTGVSYLQFDTDGVKANDMPQTAVAYDAQRA
jgi:hypothetical protein